MLQVSFVNKDDEKRKLTLYPDNVSSHATMNCTSATFPKGEPPAYQDDTMLSHGTGDNERIMAEWITILDFYRVSPLIPTRRSSLRSPGSPIPDYQSCFMSYRDKGLTMRRGIGDENDHLGSILSPLELGQRSGQSGCYGLRTVSSTSSYLLAYIRELESCSSPINPRRYSCTFGISDENGLVLVT